MSIGKPSRKQLEGGSNRNNTQDVGEDAGEIVGEEELIVETKSDLSDRSFASLDNLIVYNADGNPSDIDISDECPSSEESEVGDQSPVKEIEIVFDEAFAPVSAKSQTSMEAKWKCTTCGEFMPLKDSSNHFHIHPYSVNNRNNGVGNYADIKNLLRKTALDIHPLGRRGAENFGSKEKQPETFRNVKVEGNFSVKENPEHIVVSDGSCKDDEEETQKIFVRDLREIMRNPELLDCPTVVNDSVETVEIPSTRRDTGVLISKGETLSAASSASLKTASPGKCGIAKKSLSKFSSSLAHLHSKSSISKTNPVGSPGETRNEKGQAEDPKAHVSDQSHSSDNVTSPASKHSSIATVHLKHSSVEASHQNLNSDPNNEEVNADSSRKLTVDLSVDTVDRERSQKSSDESASISSSDSHKSKQQPTLVTKAGEENFTGTNLTASAFRKKDVRVAKKAGRPRKRLESEHSDADSSVSLRSRPGLLAAKRSVQTSAKGIESISSVSLSEASGTLEKSQVTEVAGAQLVELQGMGQPDVDVPFSQQSDASESDSSTATVNLSAKLNSSGNSLHRDVSQLRDDVTVSENPEGQFPMHEENPPLSEIELETKQDKTPAPRKTKSVAKKSFRASRKRVYLSESDDEPINPPKKIKSVSSISGSASIGTTEGEESMRSLDFESNLSTDDSLTSSDDDNVPLVVKLRKLAEAEGKPLTMPKPPSKILKKKKKQADDIDIGELTRCGRKSVPTSFFGQKQPKPGPSTKPEKVKKTKTLGATLKKSNPGYSKKVADAVDSMALEIEKPDPDIQTLQELMKLTQPYRQHMYQRCEDVPKVLRFFPALQDYRCLKKEFEEVKNAKLTELLSKLSDPLELEYNRFRIVNYTSPDVVIRDALEELKKNHIDDDSALLRDIKMLCLGFQSTNGSLCGKLYKQRAADGEKFKGVTPTIDIVDGVGSPECRMAVYCEKIKVCDVPNFFEAVIVVYCLYWIFNLQYESSAQPLFELFDSLIGH